ncbi:MAG: toll/interleukin-1 receptor domain-containing protein [Myxococcales bacterium]|nr:toll/interleukin-1 receptor domain-containing protein [Myxococcales bacterium]
MSVPTEGGLPRYDVAISYAKEDRDHAEALAHHLQGRGCRVFLDAFEPLELWGADVGRRLAEAITRT